MATSQLTNFEIETARILAAFYTAAVKVQNRLQFAPSWTVTMHGDLVDYPGVVLEVYPETGRAKVQHWCDIRKSWITNGVDLCRLENVQHEIGECLGCRKWDWYSAFDDDCRCVDCQPLPDAVLWADEDDSDQELEAAWSRFDDRWADRR